MPVEQISDTPPVYIAEMPDWNLHNPAICKELEKNSVQGRGSHFFAGRYENLYLDIALVPSLQPVLDAARQYVAEITNTQKKLIKLGFWFNIMQPGDRTLAHSHDDYDEILSGVYYLKIPDNSGSLFLSEDKNKIEITPHEGRFVFFTPDIEHEVGENNSQSERISIAFNAGLVDSA